MKIEVIFDLDNPMDAMKHKVFQEAFKNHYCIKCVKSFIDRNLGDAALPPGSKEVLTELNQIVLDTLKEEQTE